MFYTATLFSKLFCFPLSVVLEKRLTFKFIGLISYKLFLAGRHEFVCVNICRENDSFIISSFQDLQDLPTLKAMICLHGNTYIFGLNLVAGGSDDVEN